MNEKSRSQLYPVLKTVLQIPIEKIYLPLRSQHDDFRPFKEIELRLFIRYPHYDGNELHYQERDICRLLSLYRRALVIRCLFA